MSPKGKFLSIMLPELGLGYGLDELDKMEGRKFLQKSTYLIQEEIPAIDKGKIWLGFHYNLYLHGPYSPDLAEYGYHLIENRSFYSEYADDHYLVDDAKARIKAVADLINRAKEVLEEKVLNTMELLTTVHFLYSKSFSYMKEDEDDRKKQATKRCHELKPQFSRKKCEIALNLLLASE